MMSKKTKHESYTKVSHNPVKYNVLVAGASGVGKSAVINMIFDKYCADSSSDAVGCTDECSSVRSSVPGYSNVQLRLVDTVGLNESLEGTVASDKAMDLLERKLNSLYSKDGLHLILFCIRKGRQSKATSDHYQIIVRNLCENQVPCLLVITHCDDDDPLDKWWIRNAEALQSQLKFVVIGAVSVTTLKTNNMPENYYKSRQTLIEAIRNNALKEPWHATNIREKLGAIFRHRGVGSSNIPPKKQDSLTEYLQRPMGSSGVFHSVKSFFSR